MRYLAGLLITLFIATSCVEYKGPAKGTFFDVLVVMDSTKHDSQVADSIRKVFGYDIVTLPSPEPAYDLQFYSLKTQDNLDFARNFKNVIFAATLDGEGNTSSYLRSALSEEVLQSVKNGAVKGIPLRDRWATNQWALYLVGNNQEELAEFIGESAQQYVQTLTQRELARWDQEMYERGRQVEVEDTLWNDYGFKFAIQHDYKKNIDTVGFVSFRRFLPDNDRWLWVWWQDDVESVGFLDPEWVNQKRDSILKVKIRGSREDSYVTTEYRRNVITEPLTINGNYALETTGTWKMTNDLMGGPFVNFTIYDKDNQRLFMVEISQFAPKYTKRRFVRQFQAMGRTFKTKENFEGYPEPDSDSDSDSDSGEQNSEE
jgi:hypothetical protein